MRKTTNKQVKSTLEQINEKDLYDLLVETNKLLHKICSKGIDGEIKIVNILGSSDSSININMSNK